MNKEIKDKWINALRSGDYKQGIGRLRDGNDKFCCLGVLCDITIPESCEYDMDGEFYRYQGQSAYLHPEHRKELDIDYYITGDLMALNDNGNSFREIADYIERNL